MKHRIRLVDPVQDSEHLATIYSRYVREAWVSFEVEPPTAEDMKTRAQTVLDRGLPYLIAEDSSGAVLGYAYASPYRARTAYQFSVENSIYLAEHAHGKGVAQGLMNALVEHCQAMKLKTMIAIVGLNPDVPVEQNQSVRFHQKFGFSFVGVLDNIGHKFGRWTGTAVLVMDLQSD